jgi:triosephosphate isomerase (TIM)
MILINFKTYPQAFGRNAIALARKASNISDEKGIEIICCPQFVDLKEAVLVSSHPVWAQHVDPDEQGRATGKVIPEVLVEIGVEGVLLNHSEHKLSFEVLKQTMPRCKQIGLKTLVFADSYEEAVKVSELEPDWIGYEPPELVGSSATSVAESRPEVIESIVVALPNMNILVGAGVKSRRDVQVSVQRGASAVGIASGIVLAENPEDVILDLVEGFRSG